MKLPFVSRKEYNRIKKNYEVEAEARRTLRKQYVDAQMDWQERDSIRNESYGQMEDNCKRLCDRLDYMECELKDAKNEIKRLRQLCTRNNVVYKKEGKE